MEDSTDAVNIDLTPGATPSNVFSRFEISGFGMTGFYQA